MKYILKLTLIIASFSCATSDKKVDFEGVWVDKNYHKGNKGNLPFPLILIQEKGEDSVLVYYSPTKKNMYKAEFTYESYFVHLDKHTEYFLIPDIDAGELVFSDLQDKVYGRFERMDKAPTKAEILAPDFDLDTFIQTAK